MPSSFMDATILIVSASSELTDDLCDQLLDEDLAPPLQAQSITEVRRILTETDIDLILMDSSLPNEEILPFALELIRNRAISGNIIMLVEPEHYGRNLYQAERLGLVALKKPLDTHLLLQTMRLLFSFQAKIRKLESRADKLQQRIEDDRSINRAKLLLMDQLKMSEADAHHFIERKAMDVCRKKREVADDIIRQYDSNSS